MNAVALHSPRHHRVAFKIGPYGVQLEFQCNAEPGASCRRDPDVCMFVHAMRTQDGIAAFTGEKTWARSGGITPEYRADHWTWSYTT
jgi:hypothetical protein